MRVAIFCPFVHWPTHFATDLELAQRHLDAGDTVTMLTCDAELPTCDVNLGHDLARCGSCVERRRAGLGLLSAGVPSEPLAAHAPAAAWQRALPRFTDIAALKAFHVDGFDLGNAALSSLIFHRRDADCDLEADHEVLAALLRTALVVYAATTEYLRRHPVDRVYVFNTRFASSRGVMRACARHGVECVAHERGCDLRHFDLYPNVFPHDRAQANRTMRDLWARADATERRDVGSKWYLDKAAGIELYERSFVAGQQLGQLPAGWDPARRNVVVFTSSEDEFAAIGEEWDNPVYRNELAGVLAIVASVDDLPPDMHVYVRVHPNLRGIDNRQTRGLAAIAHPRVTVVPADSPISTYALLRQAATVVTFGSTVGIEAVYWGVPSILAGVSWYRDLGGTYNPSTHAELMAMVAADLPPKDTSAALVYGFFSARFGTPFRYYRATSYDGGEFQGVDVWQAGPEVRG